MTRETNVEQLAEQVEQLSETVEKLTETVEKEREARKRAEAKADAATAHAQQLWSRLERFEETMQGNLNGIHARISKEVSDPNESDSDTSEPAPDDPPIYDLLQVSEHRVSERLSPTERRARFFWQDMTKFTKSAAGGDRIVRAGDMRRILQAHESDHSTARIESKMVYRVMELSKTLTRDVAEIKKKDGEYRLVIPRDWKERARRQYEGAGETSPDPAGAAASAG